MTAQPPSPGYSADLIVLALLVAFKLLDVYAARRRDRKHGETLELRLQTLQASFDAGLRELRAFIVGPDGKNGLRGDLRDLAERVDAAEKREMDALRAAAERRTAQPIYDRRSQT